MNLRIETYGLDGFKLTDSSIVSSLYTRYASYKEGRPNQFGRLHPIDEVRPLEARYSGPLYELDHKQAQRNRQFATGWEVPPVGNCIANELANECEAAGRAWYLVHIETDEEDAYEVFWEAAEMFLERLGVHPSECTCFYSGGRSPHVHVPHLVREDDREELKRIAETVNAEVGQPILDTGIYETKQSFRLPGVPHQSPPNQPKIPIDWGSDLSDIARQYAEMDRGEVFHPMTMDDLLSELVGDDLASKVWTPEAPTPDITTSTIGGSGSVLADGGTATVDASPRNAQPDGPGPEVPSPGPSTGPDTVSESSRGMAPSNERRVGGVPGRFSPFLGARGGNRSVAVVTPLERYPGENGFLQAIVGGIGCTGHRTGWRNGAGFYDTGEVRLGEKDQEKAPFEVGQPHVFIGGKNGRCRMLDISDDEADPLLYALQLGGRDEALALLESRGYDTGSAGRKAGCEADESASGDGEHGRWVRAQRAVERGEEHPLDWEFNRLRSLACSLLQRKGWEGTREWCEEHFGERFDPEETKKHLGECVRYIERKADHVRGVPSKERP